MIDRGINAPAGMLIINDDYRSTYQVGLSNQQFTAGSIKYVSSEVRAVIMSWLQAELRDTILTVGAASIAVESALVAAEGALIAVEHSPRDCATMEENARKFGLNNVTVVGSVDEAEALPVPGTAFLMQPTDTTQCIRLNFSTPTRENIVRGMEILGEMKKEY